MKKLDRVALVTGATSGIGRAVALELAKTGMRVIAAGRNSEALSTLQKTNRLIVGAPADLSEDAGIDTVINQVKKVGHLDVLIHSAGIIDILSIAKTDTSAFDRQYRINVRAVLGLTHGVLRFLTESQGQVVFLNSTAGLSVKPGTAAYSVTKYGLRAYADALRMEINRYGVRVMSIFSGSVATPMQQFIRDKQGTPFRPDRLVQPADIASLITFLLAMPKTAEVTDVTIRPFMKS